MRKKDILKSFSKVHNRKLKLLEQDEELPPEEENLDSRKQAALQKLKGVVWSQASPGTPAWQASIETGVASVTGRTTRELSYNSNTGKITAARFQQAQVVPANADPNSGPGWIQDLAPVPGKDPSTFKKFLGIIVGDTELSKSKTQRAREDKTRAGGVLDQMDDIFAPETKEQIRSNLEAISNGLDALWEGMDGRGGVEEENQQAYDNTITNFQKQFVGSNAGSFENKLLVDKTNLQLVNGEWQATTKRPTAIQTVGVSESVKDLVQLGGTENPTKEQCESVTRDFALQAGSDRIIISPKGDGEDRVLALSFSDPKKTLRNTLIRSKMRCGLSLEEAQKSIKIVAVQSDVESVDGGGDNAARGFAFEEMLEVFSLLQMRPKGEASADLEELTANKAFRVLKRLNKLKANSEKWVEAAKSQGMSPEQAQLISEVAELASNVGDFNPQNLYGSMLYHSKNALSKRKPAYILPVGTETKRGKRQDVLEVYKTREEALAAAESMGVQINPEEFSSLDEALRGEVGILRKDGKQVKLSEILENSGKFEKNAPVYTLKVSLKNYVKFQGEGALMGGGMKTTFPELLTSTDLESFDEPFMQTIQDIVSIKDVKQFKKYAYKIQAIGRKVEGLGTSLYTKSGKITTNNLDNLSKIARAAVRDNGMDMTAAGRALKKALDTFQKNVKIAGVGDAEYVRAQQYTARFFESVKLFGDLRSEDEQIKRSAQQFLASQMLHAGGSDDDETLCDYRALNTDEDYIFKQNEPLREAWKSVMDGVKDSKGSSWEIVPDIQTGKYELVVKGNPKVKITFLPIILPRKSGGEITNYATQYQCRMNRTALQYFNKLKTAKNEQATVSEAFKHVMIALSLLQEKVSVVDS